MSQPPTISSQPPYYAPSAPKKANPWKWIVIMGAIVSGGFLLLCCGISAIAASASHKSSTTILQINGTPKGSKGSVATARGAKVGDTIVINNVSVTLVSTSLLNGDGYYNPKPSYTFIVIRVKVANHSSDTADYNMLDFRLKTGMGDSIYAEDGAPSTYENNDQLQSGELAVGGSTEGDLIFQVQPHDHQAMLVWQQGLWASTDDSMWNLGL